MKYITAFILMFLFCGCNQNDFPADDQSLSYQPTVSSVVINSDIQPEEPVSKNNEPTNEEIQQWLAEQKRIDEQEEKIWREKLKQQADKVPPDFPSGPGWESDPPKPKRALSFPKSPITEPEELQAKREDFISELFRKGIFDSIEMPGNVPRLWIAPAFYLLDFKTKSSFVEIVYAYYFDKPDKNKSRIWGDTVRIIDNYTGKDIGSYSLGQGGLKLK